MRGMSTRIILTLVLCATPVLADEDCAVPMTDWQPREAVVKLAAEKGWDLRRIRIDDGCYEVTGRDADGRRIEVKLDPASLAVVEFEFEDDREDHGD
jgi:hypothetical protein